jgi:hypothetical protein
MEDIGKMQVIASKSSLLGKAYDLLDGQFLLLYQISHRASLKKFGDDAESLLLSTSTHKELNSYGNKTNNLTRTLGWRNRLKRSELQEYEKRTPKWLLHF